ncbi:hypothetical protein BD779DRAFT_1554829 [Infundibulicybe gibba]|nr:hypothetical protein BD779DRAFT_1554829 [Infundibulicybe gibba]
MMIWLCSISYITRLLLPVTGSSILNYRGLIYLHQGSRYRRPRRNRPKQMYHRLPCSRCTFISPPALVWPLRWAKSSHTRLRTNPSTFPSERG